MAEDARLRTAVEVHSDWGTFEWIMTDALELGYRVGLVCNSDGHKGAPGACYPGASEFGAYENMRKMEQKQSFRLAGGRMMPKDRDNPNSYKVRRAKVGGYRDYFSDDQVAQIDRRVRETLDKFYGY